MTLLFTLAEDQAVEIRLYRSWWAQRKVDGVFLVDLQVRDRRIRVREEMTMPAVVLGAPRGARTLAAVWQGDEAATRTVIGYLAGLGAAQRMGIRVPAGPPPGSTARPDGPRQHGAGPGFAPGELYPGTGHGCAEALIRGRLTPPIPDRYTPDALLHLPE